MWQIPEIFLSSFRESWSLPQQQLPQTPGWVLTAGFELLKKIRSSWKSRNQVCNAPPPHPHSSLQATPTSNTDVTVEAHTSTHAERLPWKWTLYRQHVPVSAYKINRNMRGTAKAAFISSGQSRSVFVHWNNLAEKWVGRGTNFMCLLGALGGWE